MESIGGDTQSTNTHSQYKGALSSFISSMAENNQDETQKRNQRIRERVTKQERERCFTYMNDQQYITYQMERKMEVENAETRWIEMSTDVQCRTEIIKAKIKDLAPDLFMKSVR